MLESFHVVQLVALLELNCVKKKKRESIGRQVTTLVSSNEHT